MQTRRRIRWCFLGQGSGADEVRAVDGERRQLVGGEGEGGGAQGEEVRDAEAVALAVEDAEALGDEVVGEHEALGVALRKGEGEAALAAAHVELDRPPREGGGQFVHGPGVGEDFHGYRFRNTRMRRMASSISSRAVA